MLQKRINGLLLIPLPLSCPALSYTAYRATSPQPCRSLFNAATAYYNTARKNIVTSSKTPSSASICFSARNRRLTRRWTAAPPVELDLEGVEGVERGASRPIWRLMKSESHTSRRTRKATSCSPMGRCIQSPLYGHVAS
eukprot:1196038-Prorocentrum_minimum.AAC.4